MRRDPSSTRRRDGSLVPFAGAPTISTDRDRKNRRPGSGLIHSDQVPARATADVALRRWGHIGVPAIGLLVIGWVLYGNIYPVPAAPVKFFPYIALGYFLSVMGFSVAYRRTIAAGDVFLGSPAPGSAALPVAEAPSTAV